MFIDTFCRLSHTLHVSLFVLLAVLFTPAKLKAQTDCGGVYGYDHYGVPSSESCDVQAFESRCWRLYEQAYITNNELTPPGYPLHLSLTSGFGPGDFPPRKLDPMLSSSPMVSREVTHFGGPNPRAERPTHNDVIDLITGVPLIQEIDFELPFGGAVFRHVRTYSESLTDSMYSNCQWDYYSHNGIDGPTNVFWDWNGQHWAMSENPILLIDAQYIEDSEADPDPLICYMLPDAHHAIPFIKHTGTDAYVAPAWFDAILSHDDANPPNEFYVWLHRNSIKYTFQACYEDVWEESGVSLHLPHQDGGKGIPYYGLLTKIEDRYGNRAEITYCDFGQTDCDDPDTEYCNECCQNCNEKGQIQAVKLYSASAAPGEATWTLLYSHRGFASAGTVYSDLEIFNHHALHSIHVFEGDRQIPNDCLTLGYYEHFENLVSFDEYDQVDHPLFITGGDYDDWSVRVKYIHKELCASYYDNKPVDTQYKQFDSNYFTSHGAYLQRGSALLKTTVTKRVPSTEGYEYHDEYTVYRPGYDCLHPSSANPPGLSRSIFYDGTIRRIGEEVDAPDSVNYLLYEYSDSDTIFEDDPSTYENEERTLLQCADIYYDKFDSGYYGNTDRASQLEDYLSPDPDYMQSALYGRNVFCDNRGDRDDNGSFVFHSFHAYPPEAIVEKIFSTVSHEYTPFHWPYRANEHDIDMSTDGLVTLPFDQPFHIMVIDELDPNSVDATGLPSVEYSVATALGVVKRRVVEMNPAGLVLLDTTWDFTTDAAGEIVSRFGAAEQREYDCYGRVIERMTKGWNSPENQGTEDSKGLIYVFEYEDNGCNCEQGCAPGELKAVGIRQGTAGQVYYIESYSRHPDRSDLITKEVKYPTPADNPTSSSAVTTWTSYTFIEDPDTPTREWPIATKTIARPAAQVTAEDPSEYFAGQKWTYDAEGNSIWQGAGLFADLDVEHRPINAIEFTFGHSGYNDYGQMTLGIQDVDVTKLDPDEGPPSDYVRISSCDVPLHSVTTNEYNLYGLTKSVHPNLRETHIVYRTVSGDAASLDVWTYRDVIPPDEGPCVLTSPVDLSEIRGGRIEKKWQIHLESTTYPPSGNESFNPEDPEQVISVQDAIYDVNGQVVGFETAGNPGETAIGAHLAYGAGGLLLREEGPDGTITRNVYDKFGRLSKVYSGTSDIHPFWGSAPPWDPDDPEFPYPDGYPDNLVLTEKRYYGDGVTDMDRLTRVRHYNDKPDNQYFEEPDEGDPIIPNNEDEIGWATEFEYDWRMREVWVQRRAEDMASVVGAPLTHTLTWYDNLDRVRFVAEFSDTAPTDPYIDPRAAVAGATEPTAADILASSDKLLSLTENVYNNAGQVRETRQYVIGDHTNPNPDNYTATITFYNNFDKPVEVHTPNSPIHKYVYDAKGRPVVSSSYADSLEVTRTETQYDDNDRAIVTTHYERIHGHETNNDLDPAVNNCIRTYTHTWYDDAGKVTATANYGTYTATFSDATTPPTYDTSGPPMRTADVLVNEYEYDETGRQSAITHPDGTVTRYEYDGLGRLMMTTENADGDWSLTRRTAYHYDDSGRLDMMAAIPVQQTGWDWDDINWGASDVAQFTQFIYDAQVVDSAGTAISANNAWISEVRYPHRATGAPDPAQALKFTYYSDGSVATREDARGGVFTHTYDELGRRITTEINDSAWYGSIDSSLLPPYRIIQIDYEYNAEGALTKATAWADDPDTPGTAIVVSENKFDYDGFDNLIAEWQQHFNTVNESSTPVIDYYWDFSAFNPNSPSTGNYNRLANMIYPAREYDGSRRTILMDYGSQPGDIDDLLSRITKISDTTIGGTGANTSYTYAGLARRVGMLHGNNVGYVASPGGSTYDGLDRFGRVTDLFYVKDGTSARHRYRYGYDEAGNRTHARVRQAQLGAPSSHANDRSYLYGYDALNRLVDADMGMLNATNDAIVAYGSDPNAPIPWTADWNLDILGNWSGGDANNGSLSETGDFGTATTRFVHHDTNQANEISALIANDGSVTVTTTFVHDYVGNLVFDDTYWYQYDAWNRLVQINRKGTLTIADFDLDSGFLIPPDPSNPDDPDGEPGDALAQFVYDGLGRLIVQKTSLNTEYARATHLYYDGVRRIMERYYEVASQSAGPMTMLMEALSFTFIQPGWYEWEYIWGPDYVDELAFVVNANVDERYALQDANYNLVAWLKPASAILSQYTYGPYGDLRAADVRPNHTLPPMGVGHQGLFFVRLDGTPDDPPLETGAHGLYYNRNRWYSPELGRFMQRDVNETALPILTAYAFNGAALSNMFGAFRGQGLYADGMNLYLYARGNPINGRDPFGLYYDPFADVDDCIAGIYAERAQAAGNAMRFFERTAEMAIRMAIEGLIISLVPGGTFIVGGMNMYEGLADVHNNGWNWGNGLQASLGSVPLVGKAAAYLGKAFGAFGRHVRKLSNWGGRGSSSGKYFITPNSAMIGFTKNGKVVAKATRADTHRSLAMYNHLLNESGDLQPGVEAFVAWKYADGLISPTATPSFPPVGGKLSETTRTAVLDFFE